MQIVFLKNLIFLLKFNIFLYVLDCFNVLIFHSASFKKKESPKRTIYCLHLVTKKITLSVYIFPEGGRRQAWRNGA
jgi:hypothetical protein